MSIGGGSGGKPPDVVAGVFDRAGGGAEGELTSVAGRRAAAAGFGLRRGSGTSGINSDGGMT